MQHDQHQPAAKGRKERGRSVDRARQHRRENESEHRIERRLLRQESLVATPNDR